MKNTWASWNWNHSHRERAHSAQTHKNSHKQLWPLNCGKRKEKEWQPMATNKQRKKTQTRCFIALSVFVICSVQVLFFLFLSLCIPVGILPQFYLTLPWFSHILPYICSVLTAFAVATWILVSRLLCFVLPLPFHLHFTFCPSILQFEKSYTFTNINIYGIYTGQVHKREEIVSRFLFFSHMYDNSQNNIGYKQ